MTATEASSLWLDSLKSQYVKVSTLRHYRLILGQLAAWAGGMALEKLTALQLSRFMGSLEICQNTAIERIKVYKTFFRFCEAHGFLKVSPARDLKSPKYQPPDKHPFTQAEIIAILTAAGSEAVPATD